jgi:uncharacterized membrane protein YkoI
VVSIFTPFAFRLLKNASAKSLPSTRIAGGTVTETAKETKEDRTYYEAKIQKSGGEEIEIKVDPDGKLVSAGKEEENGEKDKEDDD